MNAKAAVAPALAAIGGAIAVAALIVAIIALNDGESDAPAPSQANAQAYTVWLVEQAIERYEREGLDATLDYYNSMASVDGSWYVFIGDRDGLILGHYDANARGQSITGPIGTDVTGYEFGAAMLATDEAGRWVTYVFNNPETGEPQRKHSWAILHDNLIFGSGWYDFSSYGAR